MAKVVAEARRLRRAKGKAGRMSYRETSARLEGAGYCNERGELFNPQSSNDRGTPAAAAATAVTLSSFRLLPIPEVKQTKR
jgi:hypothetical protein